MSLRVNRILKDTFGLDSLRPGQKKAVDALLTGHDLLCVMPTGGGKSLCYQLPALLMDGPALVISPLISLMQDQVQHLRDKGIPAALLTSRQGVVEHEDNLCAIRQGRARLIYAAPERLSNQRFQESLRSYPPALVVVDEAHCVVQWGREFRPDYQQIPAFIKTLSRKPLVCAFTATADRDMQQQLCDLLQLSSPRVVRQSLVRPNLHYHSVLTADPRDWITRYIKARQEDRGIVFCRTRNDTQMLARAMQSTGIQAECYHAGLQPDVRERIQERFAAGQIPVLTATSAFGMGVDIPDIRYVIHLGMCSSPADYVQQAGRAGRDGEPAACIQLITPAELNWHRRRLRASRDPRDAEDMQRLLHVFLDGKCISRGLTACFNEHCRRCGHCSACTRRRQGLHGPLASVPKLEQMKEDDLLRWSLRTTRKRIAAERKVSQEKVLPSHELELAARSGRLETGLTDQEATERLLAAMRL